MTGASRHNRFRANRLIGNGYAAPGNNFGLGFINAGVQENIVEDNTIVGNVHGIRLVAGTEKNVFRRNLVVGNPAVQVSVSSAPSPGYDILNLSEPGANTFQGNVCLTSVNAPCPAPAPPSLAASPNPIPVTGGAAYGTTTISWIAPGAAAVEVRVGSPSGPLFGSGNRGSFATGPWVADGMIFYLQDISDGKPLTPEHALATVVVRLQSK